MAKYPSYSEYFRIKEEETWPGRASEYGFDLNWTAGVQSECFQVGHNLKYGATNPMYGYVQGEPPTKSSYKMSGMLMRGLNPQDPSARPSGQHQFELSGDGDVNAQNVFFIGNNMTLRGSMAKEKSGTSLLKDADLKYATEDTCVSAVMAMPKFLDKTGFINYQGVLGLNFLKQKGNLVYGAECNYTNMKGMQGMSKNLVAGFGLAYEKYDPVLTREENKVNPYSLTNGKYSETAIKYTAKSFSLMPADITLTHWCKGKTIFGTGIPGGLSAMAQLQIKQDPMAAMTGKDKKNIEGKIMYSWKFEDPTFKKVQPMPGQMAPEDPLAKTVKVCLDTNRTVATCIDSKITGTPLNVSSKVSYNIPKDELKMGISLSMG